MKYTTAESQKLIGEILVSRNTCSDHRSSHESNLTPLLLESLLGSMPSGHVRNLVAENVGELVLGIRESQEAPRHVDEAARQGERVGCVLIDDLEDGVKVPPRCVSQQPLPQGRDVRVQARVVHQPHLQGDLFGLVSADLSIERLGREQNLPLAGFELR